MRTLRQKSYKPRTPTMKLWLIGALMLAVVATAVPNAAQAKRLGAGKPAGMQRDMPARTAPTAPPAKPAAAPQQAAAPAATPAAPPAATPPKRNWMGPLAGLAAGLGIAALLSHFGMGAAASNFIMMALLAAGAVFLVMFLLRRFGPGAKNTNSPAYAGAGVGSGPAAGGAQVAWPTPAPATPVAPEQSMARSAVAQEPSSLASVGAAGAIGAAGAVGSAGAATPVSPAASSEITRAFVPAAFDAESFTRTAKMIFIRLQAANDTADLDDLRRFTTPELFASIRLDIQERGDKPQTTDVQKVETEVLDVVNEADRQIVSVRFHGTVVEEKGAAAVAFNEVWHLTKPNNDSASWAIAGIEPLN
jgi:predicted lipid-binding transport protein (Tim44 family)